MFRRVSIIDLPLITVFYGSEPAFNALSLALAIAQENYSELHMIPAEEINYMPEFIEEREETRRAARRFHSAATQWLRNARSRFTLM
jgi:hypothetical protein